MEACFERYVASAGSTSQLNSGKRAGLVMSIKELRLLSPKPDSLADRIKRSLAPLGATPRPRPRPLPDIPPLITLDVFVFGVADTNKFFLCTRISYFYSNRYSIPTTRDSVKVLPVLLDPVPEGFLWSGSTFLFAAVHPLACCRRRFIYAKKNVAASSSQVDWTVGRIGKIPENPNTSTSGTSPKEC